MAKGRILVVDDEVPICRTLSNVLSDEGYDVATCNDGPSALDRLRGDPVDLVIIDLWMPGLDGWKTAERIREMDPDIALVVISGHGTEETAKDVLAIGGYDFLEKPLALERLARAVRDALRFQRLQRELRRLTDNGETPIEAGASAQDLEKAVAALRERRPLLVIGEPWTGRRSLIRKAAAAAFLPSAWEELFCGRLSPGSAAERLSGCERGAHPGAEKRQRGLMEKAGTGLLILADLDQLRPGDQDAVGRLLGRSTFTRAGGRHSLRWDGQWAATAASAESLRPHLRDLFPHPPLTIEPLRRRTGAISALAVALGERLGRRAGRNAPEWDPSALEILAKQAWPDNILGLECVILAAALSSGWGRVEGEAVDRALASFRKRSV